MTKPLTVNLAYPTIENVKEDKKTAYALSGVYSGTHGELSAILQYFYHFLHFKRLNDNNSAQIIMSIALAEMHHLEILGLLIIRLGLDPVFCTANTFCAEYYSAKNIRYSKTPKKMLLDDITAESIAITEIIDKEEIKRLIVARVKETFGFKKAPTIEFIRLINIFLTKQEEI